MSSALTMASGRKCSRMRLPSITACEEVSISAGYSGSPMLQSPEMEFESTQHKSNERKSDGDDNNNNNRSANAYLLKLLDTKDLSNDLDASPSAFNDSDPSSFSYVSMKSTPTLNGRTLSTQKSTSSQKKNNRPSQSHRHKPAEIFRKDLISAMKIPDTSQLLHEEYWVMQDPWRIEWEKGVQVPVNPKAIPTKNVRILSKETHGDFRMPRKMVKSSPEPGDKDMIDLNVLADSTCRYDLDELDVHWLKEINEERKLMRLQPLDEYSMERIMEELETQCHENMQLAIQTKEGLGIEYDEDVVCDVCRLPDCEEGNEMVFCDGCNLCVHQACYGILKVPEGSWLCKPCALGIRGSATCILCNRKGGAMKSTRSGNKWAHVSCALWIPEISIADPERMEPITKVSHVPASRWALVCSLCKERVGACIQCSVKHCVTAYHVACAIESKLDMIADCTNNNSDALDDAVIFRSYCKKHSKNRKDSDTEEEKSAEEKRSQRQHRIMELEEDFYTLVKASAVENTLSVSLETAQQVMDYWKLKRKTNFDRPLITPKHEEDTALAEAAETNLQRRLRMFTHLRQDLERVRNLCYMIGRREKTKRMTVKNMESVFLTQMKLLERRMCHEPNYNSIRMVATIQKFGKPEVCKVAQKESLLLAKTSEWTQPSNSANNSRAASPVPMQTNEADKTTAEANCPLKDSSDEFSKPDITEASTDLKIEITDDLISTRPKNGLHRKTFLSACRKRESVLRKDFTKTDRQDTQPVKEVSNNLTTQRKRNYPTNSESDFESENQAPTDRSSVMRKTRHAKAWTAWRTAGAAASPSAFTVKTDKVSDLDAKEGIDVVSKSTNLESSSKNRRTRSGKILSNTQRKVGNNVKTPNTCDIAEGDFNDSDASKVDKSPSFENADGHLVVKWESDRNDNPNIHEKSTVALTRKSSLSDRQLRSKRLKSGNSKEDYSKLSSSRTASESSNDLTTANQTSKLNGDASKPVASGSSQPIMSTPLRPPQRLAASKAKNVSGALARSCESGSCGIEDRPMSLGQGLRKRRSSTQPDIAFKKENIEAGKQRKVSSNSVSHSLSTPNASGVMSSISNIPKDDEDGGYKGDMDESDSETPGPSRHKNAFAHHRQAPAEKQNSKILSDSADASLSDYHSLSNKRCTKLTNPSKRRRLKTSRARRRCESSLVVFKGFKDVEEAPGKERVASRGRTRRESLDSSSSLASVTRSQAKDWPKNEDAAGDVLGKTNELDVPVSSPFAGGQTTIRDESFTSRQGFPPFSQMDPKVSFPNLYTPYPNPVYSEDYQKAMLHNQGLYSSDLMMNMPFVTPHSVYYSSCYPMQMWPPPPPNLQCNTASTGRSPPQPLPDSTLSPESQQKSANSVAIQASSEIQENTTISNLPSNSVENQRNSVTAMPCSMELTDTNLPAGHSSIVKEEPIFLQVPELKKKKKKSKKKKKKKKKRKRKMSQNSIDSKLTSDGSSAYDEYCVEYCSTLPKPAPIDQIPSEPSPAVSDVASDSSHSNLKNTSISIEATATSFSIKPAGEAIITSQPPLSTEPEGSKLLLKIDKKRLVLSQESEVDSSDDSLSAGSDDNVDTKAHGQAYITPLKLKLCGQKSDRTLRGGLVAREYQILENDAAAADVLQEGKNLPSIPPKPTKPNRTQAALQQRLGLLDNSMTPVDTGKIAPNDKSHPSKPHENIVPPLTSSPIIPAEVASKVTLKQTVNPGLALRRKRGRLKKPSKGVVDITGTITSSETGASSLCSIRTLSAGAAAASCTPSSKHVPPPDAKLSSPETLSSMPHPALEPERHWKKRKLRVLETSAPTQLKPHQPSSEDAFNASMTSPNSADSNQTATRVIPPTPVTVNTSLSSIKVPVLPAKTATATSPQPSSPATGSNVSKRNNSEPSASNKNLQKLKDHTSLGSSMGKSGKSPRKKSSPDVGKSIPVKPPRPQLDDGLPPVSPYKFTIASIHQKKMAAGSSTNVVNRDKMSLHKLFSTKKQKSGHGNQASEATTKQATHTDPYEFADFGS